MHLVLGVAYGLGLYNLALELVGLEGFIYGTLDSTLLEALIFGIQWVPVLGVVYAGLSGLEQR